MILATPFAEISEICLPFLKLPCYYYRMSVPKERILLVENDPEVSDLIARQTLQPMGYRVEVVVAAAPAIQEAARFSPDVIIANLNLPGLSGKDLLVALSSQGLDVPIIVIAEKGSEGDVIQAFRLGASDFVSWPVREAEVIAAVERVLRQVRARRERELLARQLKQTNQELQRRVRELTTIFAIGKAVISVTDQRSLFDKIIEGAVYVTEADSGWLLVRDDHTKGFVLSACKNLPKQVNTRINEPWDDGLSSLVALSGEPLSIHGDPLKRFKVSRLGQSALVVPVKVKKEVMGLMVVVRKSPQPFGSSNQALLEAVADYASISLVNARLFRALEDRVETLQISAESAQGDTHISKELLKKSTQELRDPLMIIKGNIDMLLGKEMGKLTFEQNTALSVVQERMKYVVNIVEAMSSAVKDGEGLPQDKPVDLNVLARQALSRFQSVAQQANVTLFAELSPKALPVRVNTGQIARVLDGYLSNAIRFSPPNGQITLKLVRTADNQAHISVQDRGMGIDPKNIAGVFDPNFQSNGAPPRTFGGLGIGLPLIKDVITAHQGKVWAESTPGEGAVFHFSLPIAG